MDKLRAGGGDSPIPGNIGVILRVSKIELDKFVSTSYSLFAAADDDDADDFLFPDDCFDLDEPEEEDF